VEAGNVVGVMKIWPGFVGISEKSKVEK